LSSSFCQTTIVLQPDATLGIDVVIDPYYPTLTDNSTPEFNASAWTNGGGLGIQRSLINFDFGVIPQNATIQSAILTLYNNPTSQNGFQNGEHSHVSGSNSSVLQRIVDPWQINSVNWNNQPATDTLNQVFLAQDTNVHQDYILNISGLIQERVQNPSNNYGFMLKLLTEQPYRCLIFASSNHNDPALHPKLVITYEISGCTNIKNNVDIIIDPYYPTFTDDATPEFNTSAWTNGGSLGIQRTLIDFDFSNIPANAVIQSATLTLYNNPTSNNGFQNGEHSHISGSNESVLQRITGSWQPGTVNWNNQPSTDAMYQSTLPQDTNVHQDYIIDVTDLIRDRIQNPLTTYGFMLKLVTEQPFRCLVFASSNHPNQALHPNLELCYTIPTGISENEISHFEFSIYPNPANKNLHIQFNHTISGNRKIEIIDITGRKVLEKLLPINSMNFSLNIESLSAGTYLVIYSGENFSKVKKIFVE
jgi:hypothetical protein